MQKKPDNNKPYKLNDENGKKKKNQNSKTKCCIGSVKNTHRRKRVGKEEETKKMFWVKTNGFNTFDEKNKNIMK